MPQATQAGKSNCEFLNCQRARGSSEPPLCGMASQVGSRAFVDAAACGDLDEVKHLLEDASLEASAINAIDKDGITKLITRLNNFLHCTMVTSVIDGGDCRQLFENRQKCIVKIWWLME